MSERDELIKILHQEATADRVKNSPLRNVPVVAAKVEAAADAILAAGYRKPCTITTVEELDALPQSTCVWGNTAYLRVITAHGYLMWGCVGSRSIYATADIPLPVTVIYEPEATK